jgi:hypothetical protein
MSVPTIQHSGLPELAEELEGEEFLGGLARRAAQAVLGSLGGQPDGEFEEEFELEAEAEHEGEFESEFEEEGEFELEYELPGEFEYESERMANPLRRAYPDAMMEHLGHAAAEAETEAEAEAFIGALVPLAAGLVRSAAPAVARSTPQLVRGLASVARTLRRNPTTRQFVQVLPTIASRTTRRLARDVARGRPITARRAVRTLAGQTAAVLSSPRARRHAIRRARALDRTYHRAARTGHWWTAGVPGASVTGVRSLAPRPLGGYAPAGSQVIPSRVAGRLVQGRGYPRRRRYPPALSVAWVPVPAWRGGHLPVRAYTR